jgi:hypothetical protein
LADSRLADLEKRFTLAKRTYLAAVKAELSQFADEPQEERDRQRGRRFVKSLLRHVNTFAISLVPLVSETAQRKSKRGWAKRAKKMLATYLNGVGYKIAVSCIASAERIAQKPTSPSASLAQELLELRSSNAAASAWDRWTEQVERSFWDAVQLGHTAIDCTAADGRLSKRIDPNTEREALVTALLLRNPKLPCREIEKRTGISKSNVCRTLAWKLSHKKTRRPSTTHGSTANDAAAYDE